MIPTLGLMVAGYAAARLFQIPLMMEKDAHPACRILVGTASLVGLLIVGVTALDLILMGMRETVRLQ